MYRQAMASNAEQDAAARQARPAIATASVASLTRAGLEVSVEARSEDPAAEATAFGPDLIIVGSRGQTGLRRLVLRSVARRVMRHAMASALVV